MQDPGIPNKFIWMNLESGDDIAAFRAAVLRRTSAEGLRGEISMTAAAQNGLDGLGEWGRRCLERGCSILARMLPRTSCEDDDEMEELNPAVAEKDLEDILEAAWENREGYVVLELTVDDDDLERMQGALEDLLEAALKAVSERDPLLSPEVAMQNMAEMDPEGELRYTDRSEVRLHMRGPDTPSLMQMIVRDEDALALALALAEDADTQAIPRMEIGIGEAYGDLNRN